MSAIELVIEPRKKDLGGFSVGRVLPYAKRRMVGPFIFFDVMGPAQFSPGHGIDVRPHPHIGLATVTYLFEGEIRHRDSLGFDQVIRPGDVNWMTAGRGIVHSERTDETLRASGHNLYGVQTWVALPESDEATAPAFHHHPKSELPVIEKSGAKMRLIVGSAFGATSPAKTFSPIFYLGVEAAPAAQIHLPEDYEDRALYILDGGVSVDGAPYGADQMIIFKTASNPQIETTADTRAMLLGGAPLGDRRIWWNFVASDGALIDEAKKDWRASGASNFRDARFSLPPGETEFIPLPDD